jgi:hypothetical protein
MREKARALEVPRPENARKWVSEAKSRLWSREIVRGEQMRQERVNGIHMKRFEIRLGT